MKTRRTKNHALALLRNAAREAVNTLRVAAEAQADRAFEDDEESMPPNMRPHTEDKVLFDNAATRLEAALRAARHDLVA